MLSYECLCDTRTGSLLNTFLTLQVRLFCFPGLLGMWALLTLQPSTLYYRLMFKRICHMNFIRPLFVHWGCNILYTIYFIYSIYSIYSLGVVPLGHSRHSSIPIYVTLLVWWSWRSPPYLTKVVLTGSRNHGRMLHLTPILTVCSPKEYLIDFKIGVVATLPFCIQMPAYSVKREC